MPWQYLQNTYHGLDSNYLGHQQDSIKQSTLMRDSTKELHIIKQYYQNINVNKPKNYFERWYADLWRKFINAPTAPPGMLDRIMTQELAKIGATIEGTQKDFKYTVTFKDEESYNVFVSKWT